MDRSDDSDFLTRVSWLYYVNDLTQQEVAARLGVSRFRVLRALRRAKELGFVRVEVATDRFGREFALEEALAARFSLREAVVFNSAGIDVPEQVAARLAGSYLAHALEPGAVLAVGISATVGLVPPRLEGLSSLGCTVVSLTGAVAVAERETPGNPVDLVPAFARALGGSALRVLAPVIATTAEARAAITAEPDVAQQLEVARRADLAVIGVGHLGEDAFLRAQGVIGPEEVARLSRSGAVGDLVARYFRSDGSALGGDLDSRVVGVSLDDLRGIKRVVGVALGEPKYHAILGALRGGYLDVLVTDATTATWLCAQSTPERVPDEGAAARPARATASRGRHDAT